MSDAKFDLLLSLYRDAAFTQGREARLSITTDLLQRNLTKCLADQDEFSIIVIDGDPDDVRLGGAYVLEFGTPRTGIGLFFDSFPGLLSAPINRVVEPKRYFFLDSKYSSKDDQATAEVLAYRQILSLVETLRKSAAYLDQDSGTLVFVHDGKFEVPVIYGAADLKNIDQDALNKLLAFIGNDTHSEQKLGILESSVRELVGPLESQIRFPSLLSRLPELVTKAHEGYRLFASSFSYDKIRDQLEAVKVEYTAKIHKAFTDIQTQILSIPVATVIVSTQMKAPGKTDYEYWVNVAVLIGCWIFAALIAFSLWNQITTLEVLATEIKRQKDQIQKDYKDIAGQFTDVFSFLDRRLCQQKLALGGVTLVLIAGLVLSNFFYWKLSSSHPQPSPAVTTEASKTGLSKSESRASLPDAQPNAASANSISTQSEKTGEKPMPHSDREGNN